MSSEEVKKTCFYTESRSKTSEEQFFYQVQRTRAYFEKKEQDKKKFSLFQSDAKKHVLTLEAEARFQKNSVFLYHMQSTCAYLESRSSIQKKLVSLHQVQRTSVLFESRSKTLKKNIVFLHQVQIHVLLQKQEKEVFKMVLHLCVCMLFLRSSFFILPSRHCFFHKIKVRTMLIAIMSLKSS